LKAELLQFDRFREAHPGAQLYVFDVDHTLTRKSTGIRYAMEGFRRGFVRKRTILSFPFRYINYCMGSYGVDDLPQEFKDLKGHSRRELDELSTYVFDTWVKSDVYEHAAEFVKQAIAARIPVVLSSSSLDFMLAPLGRWLGTDAIYATSVSFDKDDICSGDMKGKPNFSSGKIDHVRDDALSRGLTLADVAFFSDSINDYPLLQAVGHPVPTNADFSLSRKAKQHHWKPYTFEA